MKLSLVFIIFLLSAVHLNAQEISGQPEDQVLSYTLGTQFSGTSKGTVPFWMRTNKFGEIPLSGISEGFFGSISKKYDGKRGFDWGYGVNAHINVGNSINVQLIEAYLKLKYKVFQFKAGRSKDIIGIVDSTLSSGSYSVSGNALGIPRAEISIPDYTAVPFTNSLLAVKGNFSFGWIGNEPISRRSYISTQDADTYFHQKSIYFRLGKPASKLKLYGGFNHNVYWGDENRYFKNWNLSALNTFIKVVTGGTHKDSKVGNHGGSLDQQIEYNFNSVNVKAYHQFFYEVGGLAHLNNIKDGLFGFVVQNNDKKNLQNNKRAFRWNKLLLEVFTSKSQGGELDAKITPSGDEDYYNNYLYLNGWTYSSENLGNNFITNKKYMRKELPQLERESHTNNRLYLIHVGADVDFNGINILGKLSFSKNFGTYGTSPIGNSTGKLREISPPPYFQMVRQLSGYLELNKNFANKFNLGLVIAADKGGLLYNSTGSLIKISKTF